MPGFDGDIDVIDQGALLDDDEFESFGQPEGWDRYVDAWFGKYRAIVKDVSDPQKLSRIRVQCIDIYGDELSPWIEPANQMGSDEDSGHVWIPLVGAPVYIEFEKGNPDFAIWSPCMWMNSENSLPNHAQGNDDETDENLKGKGVGFVPTSTYNGEYPYWKGLKTPGGHMIEYDDTPGAERIQIYHKNGSHIEIHQDGKIIIASGDTIKIASIGGDVRIASMDSSGAITGNEIGMSNNLGWLGQKSSSTEPLICGNLAITFFTALITATSGIAAATKTVFEAIANDASFQGTYPAIATACSTGAGALGAIITTLGQMAAIYFTPGLPTSIISDLWKTAKTITPPEA